MKKHAFLIGAYKNPDYLLELIDSLDSERSCIYIHVNKYNDKVFSELKNKIANRKNIHYYSCLKIKYGGSAFCRSQMLLLNEALKDNDNQYFHFITGQDILCRPLEEFMEYVEAKKTNFIEYRPIPDRWKYRYTYYSFYDILDVKKHLVFRALNKLFRIFQETLHVKRSKFDFSKLYVGSAWWSLERNACQYVLSKWNNEKKIRKRVKNTFAPDEMIVQTILLNAEVQFPVVNDNLRYIKWNGKTSPRTLTIEDFEDIKKSGKFVARKVDPKESTNLINAIRASLS